MDMQGCSYIMYVRWLALAMVGLLEKSTFEQKMSNIFA